MNLRSVLLPLLLAVPVRADEGLWTFDHPPIQQIRKDYGVFLSPGWLEHLRLAALLLDQGSGAFVSPDGLVLTNQHVIREALQDLDEDAGRDWLRKGFQARSRKEEAPVPHLTVATLARTVDVTAQVAAALPPGLDEAGAAAARARILQRLARDLAFATRLQVVPVTLHQGGETWLYAYQVHTDVRLVLVPEAAASSPPGALGEFLFPRQHVDFALLRVYELGAPYRPPHWLRWSRTGASDGGLAFVAGNPGRTRRGETVARMEYERDVEFPDLLARRKAERDRLQEWAQASPGQARQVEGQLLAAGNAVRVAADSLASLREPGLLDRRRDAEADLRAAVARDPGLRAAAGDAWDRVAAAVASLRAGARGSDLADAHGSTLLQEALDLVRVAGEAARPAGDRLRDYRSREDLARQRQRVAQVAPFDHLDLEAFLIAKALQDLQAALPPDHPLRRAVLGDRTPEQVARAAVAETRVTRAYFRQGLLDRGIGAVRRSPDPLVRLAWTLESSIRDGEAERERLRAVVEANEARIGRARFALLGDRLYPDGTGTLRLAYGPVQGGPGPEGEVPAFTTLGDLLARTRPGTPALVRDAAPLPDRWLAGKARLDPRVPLNFCLRADFIGGNSGSPVVDARGDLVGILYGGNTVNLYGNDPGNRAFCLDTRAILEVLDKIYGATDLLEELEAGR